jgi:hypothetical protein
MSDSPPHLPGDIPPPILGYHRVQPIAPERVIVYQRVGDALTITILPRPFATQVVFRTLAFLACAIPTAGIALVVLTTAPRDWTDPSMLSCIGPVTLFFSWGTFRTLRRLIYCMREGRHPAVLRASPAGLEVLAPGNVPPLALRLRRDQIMTLEVHPGGVGPSQRLILRVTTLEDNLHFVNLPWWAGHPMIEVEDNLRDVLGLATQG